MRAWSRRTEAPTRVPREPDWRPLADGRLHRLKRGKHYSTDSRTAIKAAEAAAVEMSKAVRALGDDFENLQYMWVLFADWELTPGQACPCGSLDLVRTHPGYVTCSSCGVTHPLTAEAQAPKTSSSLAAYHDVRWLRARHIEKGTAERRWGTALDPHGQRVLLIGIYWLSDGVPIADPTSPDGCRHVVQPFPIEGFRKILDLRPLEQ